MDKSIEALRLAKILENIEGYRVTMTAAHELRRLHEENKKLKEALAEHAMSKVQRLGQEIEQCQCTECQIKPHASDCAVHSEPAYPKGKCDCGAEPEQEPKIGCVNHDCDQCKAQPERLAELGWQEIDCPICGGGARAFPKPEQEPVAHTTGHCENHKQKGGCQLHNLQCGWPDCDRKSITTPPQRKPLTKEEMFEAIRPLYSSEKDAMLTVNHSEDEYRAIEAAHGIKENT